MKYFFGVLFLLLFTSPVSAGGGRISISVPTVETYVGEQKTVNATVEVEAINAGQGPRPSEYEKLEFKIENPRTGDVCVTVKGTSDNKGHIQATCTATTPGTITIYVRSLDKGDESSRYLLHFISKPIQKQTITKSPVKITPTPLPTQDATPTPTLTIVEDSSSPPSLWDRFIEWFRNIFS